MSFFNKLQKNLHYWFALVIVFAIPLGYYFPELSRLKAAIPYLLFVMLYPMMINLRIESIGKALTNLRLVLISIGTNFVISPILGALWAYLLFRGSDPYLAMGFILKVIVPCSGMVAAWTGYAKGKVESALVLISLSFILAVVMVPIWMWVLAGTYVPVHPMMLFNNMLFIVVAPLIAGLITRKLIVKKVGPKSYKDNIAPIFPGISTCGVLPMIFIIMASQAEMIIANYKWALLVILGIATLYPIIMLLNLFFSRAAGLNYEDGIALIYSSTAKNHAITIGLAATVFSGTLAVFPAAVAPIIQMPIMLAILKSSNGIRRFLENGSNRAELDGGKLKKENIHS